MKNRNINTEYTNEIVCPFCGYEFCDSWEYGDGFNEDLGLIEYLGLIECKSCEKKFYATKHISVTYCSEKAKYGICKKCNTENVVLTDYCSTLGTYKDLCVKCGDEEKNNFIKNFLNK